MRSGSTLLLIAALTLGCTLGPLDDGASGGLTFGGVSAGNQTTGNDSADPPSTGAEEPTGDGGGGEGGGSGGGSATSGSSLSGVDDGSEGDSGCIPTEELCDGIDNDCDGEIDNSPTDSDLSCNTAMSGQCADGLTRCVAGVLQCEPIIESVAELCDGVDNNCNGQVDENDPEGGAPCDTELLGVCAVGLSMCTNGALTCLPTTDPQTEQCDNLDNDCDGQVDEDNPEGGSACPTGLLGICAPGSQQCVQGTLQCQQNVEAAAQENCNNNTDDDCDGQVNNGCSSCIHDICEVGGPLELTCDPCVSQICSNDLFCCFGTWDQLCVDNVTTVCGLAC